MHRGCVWEVSSWKRSQLLSHLLYRSSRRKSYSSLACSANARVWSCKMANDVKLGSKYAHCVWSYCDKLSRCPSCKHHNSSWCIEIIMLMFCTLKLERVASATIESCIILPVFTMKVRIVRLRSSLIGGLKLCIHQKFTGLVIQLRISRPCVRVCVRSGVTCLVTATTCQWNTHANHVRLLFLIARRSDWMTRLENVRFASSRGVSNRNCCARHCSVLSWCFGAAIPGFVLGFPGSIASLCCQCRYGEFWIHPQFFLFRFFCVRSCKKNILGCLRICRLVASHPRTNERLQIRLTPFQRFNCNTVNVATCASLSVVKNNNK